MLPLRSSAGTGAETPQPVALGSPPGVCPPSGRCKAASLRTQDELKDFVSRRLPCSLGTMRPCCGNGLPGGAVLTRGEHRLCTRPGHWGEGKGPRPHACRPAGISPTSPRHRTDRTPPPRGLGGPSATATTVRWAETLAVQGAFQSRSCLGGLGVAGGVQGPPKCAHLEAAPPHLCYGREDGSPPA